MNRLAQDVEASPAPQQTQADAVRQTVYKITPSPWPIDDRISSDIDNAHCRRWPDRPANLISRSQLLAVSPGLRLILIHRIDHWLYLKRKNNSARKWLWRVMLIPIALMKLTMMRMNAKSDIANDCEIEQDVLFSDQGNIIFGARRTGSGTVIGTRVTVGMNHTDRGRPKIGRNVWIGSDCVIYGAITIGDGATLLPGTVLSRSVPPGVMMQGNPPRLVARGFDNSQLREHCDLDATHYVNTGQED
ncbi:DapH/DapD/GlmU-related protein [Candidatus Methylobacter oryzae]|uniref:Serine acetyltransferase n=1 Tax=Candidatus Methylobacter oryzae TaxID=2497749 RepID=A0ABY3C7R4_9GAMM|nr:DapH/DapD/GlmU-related protein [Candidatus Methylobacter oryzae]TRW92064.1 hypothetical protein EKO24_015470 [Candidatus Methylobacter oryzae]